MTTFTKLASKYLIIKPAAADESRTEPSKLSLKNGEDGVCYGYGTTIKKRMEYWIQIYIVIRDGNSI